MAVYKGGCVVAVGYGGGLRGTGAENGLFLRLPKFSQ